MSVIKTSQLVLYREIIAVYSQILTKHINTVCGQNVELLNVKLAVHTVTTGLYGVPIRYPQPSHHNTRAIKSVPRTALFLTAVCNVK